MPVDIITPYYTEFRQVEGIEFVGAIRYCFKDVPVEEMGLSDPFQDFDTASAEAEQKYIAPSPEEEKELTASLLHLDDQRDRAYRTLCNFSTTYSKHYDPEKARLGTLLLNFIGKFGSAVDRMPYVQETGVLKKACNELTTNEDIVSIINTLGLSQVIVDLNQFNLAFDEEYKKRIKTQAGTESVAFAETLKEAYTACKTLLRRIESCSDVFQDKDYSSLANQINQTIETYNHEVESRRSKSSVS